MRSVELLYDKAISTEMVVRAAMTRDPSLLHGNFLGAATANVELLVLVFVRHVSSLQRSILEGKGIKKIRFQ
jgi:hypothetical protein